jgi:hypothetical protein
MSRPFVAVIADAGGSRQLAPPRRARLQRDLAGALAAFNRHRPWRAELAARFAVTRGDEVEALLRSPRLVWAATHELRRAVPDVDWVIAAGRGPVTTPLAPTALEVDGPCFHHARAALEAAKQERRVIAFRGFDADRALAGWAAYYSALYWSWTGRQRQAAHEFRVVDPAVWRARAAPRRVGPSALSHLRRRMAWPLVAAGDTMFRALLEGGAS